MAIRDHDDCVTVEVCTREVLSYSSVDTNSVGCVTQQLLGLRIAVVHRQLRNLECASVWMTNQHDSFAVVEVRCVDLSVLHGADRHDDVSLLTRKVSCLKVHSSRISIVSERLQQPTLYSRVVESHDLIELTLLVVGHHSQLRLSQLRTLLGQELRRKSLRPTLPVALFVDEVHRRSDFPTTMLVRNSY